MLMIPRPTFGTPVLGDVAYYYAALAPQAVLPEWEAQEQERRQLFAMKSNELEKLIKAGKEPIVVGELLPPPPPPVPFNVPHVAVSFIFGARVATLLGMQRWRSRRRRPPAPDHEPPVAEASAAKPDGMAQSPPT
jgi:hypothetical protein